MLARCNLQVARTREKFVPVERAILHYEVAHAPAAGRKHEASAKFAVTLAVSLTYCRRLYEAAVTNIEVFASYDPENK